MRIDELDEFQGTTPQMVAEWMTRNGWKETKPNWWERGEDGFRFDQQAFDRQWFWLLALAAIYAKGNTQAMLCRINPRMRQGWPSDAALAAHKIWVVRSRASLAICKYFPCDRDLMINGEHVSCWPCDENGNKVRWPTNAAGEML